MKQYQPEDDLARIMGEVPWNISRTFEENWESLPEVLPVLTQPVPGLHRLVVHYSITAHYLHRVEYRSLQPIRPIDVLASISQFYQLPYTQENEDAIRQIQGVGSGSVPPGTKIGDVLTDHVFFEGLGSYKDGFSLVLGS